MQAETSARPRSRAYPGVLLSVPNAARLAGVPAGAVWEGIAKGCLRARRGYRNGRDIWLVTLSELREVFDQPQPPPLITDSLAPVASDAAASSDEARLRERVARLEGELSVADKVERSAQRYADRLEERVADMQLQLAAEHKQALTLARALGRVESERDRLGQAIAAGGNHGERHERAPARASGWFGGRRQRDRGR